MNWKDLVGQWLDEGGFQWSNNGSAIWVGNRNYSIKPEHNFEIYVINRHEPYWDRSPAIWKEPEIAPTRFEIWVLSKITDGWFERHAFGRNRDISDPTEHKYKVGHFSDPRFFTRLKLGMNKLRTRYDGARQCA